VNGRACRIDTRGIFSDIDWSLVSVPFDRDGPRDSRGSGRGRTAAGGRDRMVRQRVGGDTESSLGAYTAAHRGEEAADSTVHHARTVGDCNHAGTGGAQEPVARVERLPRCELAVRDGR
jgi:hypothetical protein